MVGYMTSLVSIIKRLERSICVFEPILASWCGRRTLESNKSALCTCIRPLQYYHVEQLSRAFSIILSSFWFLIYDAKGLEVAFLPDRRYFRHRAF
jgi:hypothetical protein